MGIGAVRATAAQLSSQNLLYRIFRLRSGFLSERATGTKCGAHWEMQARRPRKGRYIQRVRWRLFASRWGATLQLLAASRRWLFLRLPGRGLLSPSASLPAMSSCSLAKQVGPDAVRLYGCAYAQSARPLGKQTWVLCGFSTGIVQLLDGEAGGFRNPTHYTCMDVHTPNLGDLSRGHRATAQWRSRWIRRLYAVWMCLSLNFETCR